MVIKNEVMLPGGAYKKMSYTEQDQEVSYCNNTFSHSNGSSSMQMVRPGNHSHHHDGHHLFSGNHHHDGHHLFSGNHHESHHHVPEKHHGGHHLFGGNHHERHGLHHHGNGGHVNEVVEEKVKISSHEQRVLSGGGHREGYGSETHFASHAAREPYYYRNTETLKYSGTPNGRTHHFEFKGLDD
ncbi:unnamed protein product [Cuscuta europaea]|uniref:Uncharacterized protein n=1 Tax=Cuscuta europaea TaxID=41803 RepID=A0A9P0ZWC9_CUSEU|nr:unnamed protein product [Cuscuta europaea]